ncbi:ankyrin repeat-containing domain protein [Xylaria bambusicola]|uniref:ankyrin repeat-containing domain protein n=1 Tax=Xylaria bambusicola TaxID=326684 RepID=UPI0020085A6A|nr:ankyrin repeat-containing domain protein [Xylaria bambusicola]KAI0506798.1 ankyrin repeat-containing domain protein [Xylaria bambusicola]
MPIHIATAQNGASMLSIILQYPHDGQPATEALDKYCLTPLHVAAREGARSTAYDLIGAGADVNAASSDGWGHTALHIVTEQNKNAEEFMTSSEEDEKCAAVEKAILRMSDNKEDGRLVLETLLRAGIDVNRRSDHDGRTALHVAAFVGSTEAIEMMYAIAVPPPYSTIEDDERKTAVQVWIDEKHEVEWKTIFDDIMIDGRQQSG